MQRRVLCFDPDAGLKTPASALYPEWADGLRHFPGTLGGDDWAAVAAALAESAELPECWLLVPADLGHQEVCKRRQDVLQAIERVSGVANGNFQIVRWKVGGDASDRPDIGEIWLELCLNNGAEYADRFLLPLALRALFEREKFLKTSDQRKHLSGIKIEADKDTILAVVTPIQETLKAAGRQCRHKIALIKDESIEGYYSDWKNVVCNEEFLPKSAEEIRFGWLYLQYIDERKLQQWLNNHTLKLQLSWKTYVEAVGRWHRDELRLHNTKAPEVAFDRSRKPEAYESDFSSALLALNSGANADADGDLDASAAQVVRDRQQSVGAALRKRPTALLFKWMTASLFMFSVAVACVSTAATQNLQGIPWQWPSVVAGTILLAALLMLIVSQRDQWAALREARTALSKLENDALSDAEKFKQRKVIDIKRMLLRRNQDILRVQKERRQRSIRKHEYHLRELERHFLSFNDIEPSKWATDTGDDPECKLEIEKPAELNETYYWQGRSVDGSECKIGTSVTKLVPLDIDGRYAGVRKISFETGRR